MTAITSNLHRKLTGIDRVSGRWILVVNVLLIICLRAQSQPVAGNDSTRTSDVFHTYLEFATYGATSSRLPFWLHADKWGIVPTSGPVASVLSGIDIRHALRRKPSRKSVPIVYLGLEGVATTGKISRFLLSQGYAGISYKGLQLSVGRWRQYVGLSDYSLGTGSYIWSGNTLPLPKIQLGFHNYTPVPFTRKFLSFKGFYSDGFFENQRPVTSQLKLHNKSFFLRIGAPKGLIKLHGGFNHAVQWGGKSPYNTEQGKMPQGLRSYFYAVTGQKPHGRLRNANIFDNGNRIGNHVASIDVAAEIDLKKLNIFIYRQNLVEDGSLFYLNNIKDGLNGVSIHWKEADESRFTITGVVGELLYTKSQGGTRMEEGSHIRGNDDYFNNGQVRDGWSYFGRSLGTPFITPGTDNAFPAYADFFTNNNRVMVAHLGIQGNARRSFWMARLSFSDNDGSYMQPMPAGTHQFSGIISVKKPVNWLGGVTIAGSLASDLGKLYRNSTGIQFAIQKTGFLKTGKQRMNDMNLGDRQSSFAFKL